MSEIDDLKIGIKGLELLEEKIGVTGLIVKSDDREIDSLIIKIETAKEELKKELKYYND